MPQPSRLLFAGMTYVGPVNRKRTEQCFLNRKPNAQLWGYRPTLFDKWLPEFQPAMEACALQSILTAKRATFSQAMAEYLHIPEETQVKVFTELIKEQKLTTALTQIEEIKSDLDVSIQVKKWFFVDNRNGGISIVNMYHRIFWNFGLWGLISGNIFDANDEILLRRTN